MKSINLLKYLLPLSIISLNTLHAQTSDEDKIKILSNYLINIEKKDPVSSRNEAIATVYGKPELKNLVYDEASEMFFGRIVSEKGNFIRDVNFYMPRKRAVSFKKELSAGKINIEHAFENDKVLIKDIELDYKDVEYPLHVKESTSMQLNIGAYFLTNQDTEFLARKNGIGAVVNLQDALNMEEDTQVLRLSALYKFNDKHQVEFSYYSINNSNTAVNEKDFEYNGSLIKANSTLNVHFDTDIYKLNYIYSAYQTSKLNFSFRAGLHITSISTGIDTTIDIDNGEPETLQKNDISIPAPLPTLGISLNYEIVPNVSVNYKIDYFFVSYEHISGNMTDTILSLDYDYNKYVGVGIGFNSTNMFLKGKEKDINYELRHNVMGALTYLTLSY